MKIDVKCNFQVLVMVSGRREKTEKTVINIDVVQKVRVYNNYYEPY